MANERSEDIYGQKIDRCLYNSLIKFVSGVGIGIVFSALFFKRKPWPVILGAGIGSGMGVSDCNHEFKGQIPVRSSSKENLGFWNYTSTSEPVKAPKEPPASPRESYRKLKIFRQPRENSMDRQGPKFLYKEDD